MRSLCALAQSFSFSLSFFALHLVALACLLHVHSNKIVSHSLCLALALRLRSLCALAQDFSLSCYALCLVAPECFLRVRLKISFLIALPFPCCSALALTLRARSKLVSVSFLRSLFCSHTRDFALSPRARSKISLSCYYALALGRARAFFLHVLSQISLSIALPLACSALPALALRARSTRVLSRIRSALRLLFFCTCARSARALALCARSTFFFHSLALSCV